MHFPILTSLVALPVAGALLLLFVRGDEEQSAPAARKLALVISLLVCAEIDPHRLIIRAGLFERDARSQCTASGRIEEFQHLPAL